MSDSETEELDRFEQSVQELCKRLESAFQLRGSRYHYNENSDELYVELSGLDAYDEERIAEIAEPVLDEYDLDIESILLLPMKNPGG